MSALTPRQREVLAAYLRTGSVHATAAELGCAEQTVKNQMHSAYRALGVHSLLGALRALPPGDPLRRAFLYAVREVPA
jgi:DNA-binding NarL/FixJ family response regulator